MSGKKKFGNKELPSGLKRLFYRFPLLLYKTGLAFLLGGRFLKLTHIGRTSGKKRETVLEVVKHDEETGTVYVASGWGERSNWFQNIMENPHVEVQFKGRKFGAVSRRLDVDEASSLLLDYAGRYPKSFEVITGMILGEKLDPTEKNMRVVAEHWPVIAFEPVNDV